MKVISIKEPYASFLANGMKKIETRSWKTNYRGELFIHASKTVAKEYMTNDTVKKLAKTINMQNGNIICKCLLVDCVYMDEEFIKRIKKNKKEYYLGEYKIGRYAWILENIKPISKIPAKGHLNIWNFDGNDKIKKDKNN